MPDTTPIVPENILAQASLGIWLLARTEAPARLKIREMICSERPQHSHHDQADGRSVHPRRGR